MEILNLSTMQISERINEKLKSKEIYKIKGGVKYRSVVLISLPTTIYGVLHVRREQLRNPIELHNYYLNTKDSTIIPQSRKGANTLNVFNHHLIGCFLLEGTDDISFNHLLDEVQQFYSEEISLLEEQLHEIKGKLKIKGEVEKLCVD